MDRRTLVVGLLWDIGLPAAVYYACRAIGIDAFLALLTGGAAALLRVAYVAARRNRLDGVAAFIVVVFALLLVASLLTSDARVLLAKESIVSGAAGLVLVGSCLIQRPVMYALLRRATAGDPGRLSEWDERWRAQPQFRRVLTVISAVWGAGLLAEAVVRLPMIYLLPTDAAAGLSTALQVGTIALLLVWTLWYRRRRQRVATKPVDAARR